MRSSSEEDVYKRQVYARCNAQLQTLFLLCGILSAVSALIMVTASLIITVPVKKINEAVKIVSDDYYAYRLPVTGTDELNELSANFNVMCEAIENNIRNYKFAIDNFIHEVKTPLTSIIGYADMLKSYDCTGECREEAVDYILTQSRRLNSLAVSYTHLDVYKRQIWVSGRTAPWLS